YWAVAARLKPCPSRDRDNPRVAQQSETGQAPSLHEYVSVGGEADGRVTFVTLNWAVEGGILGLILPLYLARSIFRVRCGWSPRGDCNGDDVWPFRHYAAGLRRFGAGCREGRDPLFAGACQDHGAVGRDGEDPGLWHLQHEPYRSGIGKRLGPAHALLLSRTNSRRSHRPAFELVYPGLDPLRDGGWPEGFRCRGSGCAGKPD